MTRSRPASLLENGAEDDEIRAAIDDRFRTELETAVQGVHAELEPPIAEELAGEIAAFVSLVGQAWSAGGQKEFIGRATAELRDFPGELVLDAVQRARRRVYDGKLFVVWVCDDVEPKVAALEAEAGRLDRLAALARPAD